MRNTSIFSYVRNDISSFVNLISDKNYIFRATLINPKSLTLDENYISYNLATRYGITRYHM